MPIRFRCAYCNQLMGISTRKAGTVVRCPKCAGEIIVPAPEGMNAPEPPEAPGAAAQVFEDQAFEALLNDAPVPNDVTATAGSPAEPAPPPEPAAASPPVISPAAPPPRVGFFLSLGAFLVSLGVVILLLILVFILGVIIGRHTAGSDSSAATASGLLEANCNQDAGLA